MTKPHSAFRVPHSAWVWTLFAVAIVFVYFFGLTIPLLGPDEPRYAQVAREMFMRGDWVTPTLGGFNWFEKPALLYWLQIASYNLFGVNEFAARFGSALFGLGTIASLYILGRVVSPKTQFANWLALIAASTIGIIVFSRGASFDIILTFPMAASLVSFYIFDRGRLRRSRRYLALVSFYFFIGVALLAKGLIGAVFPFAIVGFYYLLSWRFPTKTFFISLFWGVFVAAAVASTWYVPMYQKHGWTFIDEFFVQHHFQRYTSNKYFHPQPFYFFLWVLPLMTIPWLPFFFAAVWSFGRAIFKRRDAETRREEKQDRGEGDAATRGTVTGAENKTVSMSPRLPFSPSPLLLFSFAWIAVPLAFFSFSGSKLPGYILPAVPGAIVLTAVYIWRFAASGGWKSTAILSTAALTFVVIVGALIFVVPRFAESDSVKSLIAEANSRGFFREGVIGLHTVSHNAEFYAAGRLLRTPDGKQKKFFGQVEVEHELQRRGEPVLVLVPLRYLGQLTESGTLRSTVLKDNGELALVLVSTAN